MHNILLNTLFVLVVVTGSITIGSSFGLPSSFTPCNVKNEMKCDITCKNYGICFNNSKNEMVFHVLETCGNSCTKDGCVDETNFQGGACSIPNAGTIACVKDGIYPDPYDSRRSLTCSRNGVVSLCNECANGCYNSTAKICDEMENGQCPSSLETVCRKVGEVGVMPADKRFYYVCFIDSDQYLYPIMYKCDDGIFDIVDGICTAVVTGETITDKFTDEPQDKCEYINSSSSTTTTSTTTPKSTTTTTTTTTTKTTTTTTESSGCQKQGDVFHDPDVCTEYYRCDMNLNKIHMACFPNQYFNREKKTCDKGYCPYA